MYLILFIYSFIYYYFKIILLLLFLFFFLKEEKDIWITFCYAILGYAKKQLDHIQTICASKNLDFIVFLGE